MTEYEENPEFKTAIDKMLADTTIVEFNPIREHPEVLIFSLLCIRTNKDGDHIEHKGEPIICRKIAAPFQALTGGHYLVIADYYFWNHANPIQQEAQLYHALMHINIEVDKEEEDEDKKLKLGIRRPEVHVFPSEVLRFGAHTAGLLDIREALKQSAKQLTNTLAAKE
ncbi:MAG: putative metallopeptidase [Verrucomicrobiota bacterium]|jgi:hypothetical protein